MLFGSSELFGSWPFVGTPVHKSLGTDITFVGTPVHKSLGTYISFVGAAVHKSLGADIFVSQGREPPEMKRDPFTDTFEPPVVWYSRSSKTGY